MTVYFAVKITTLTRFGNGVFPDYYPEAVLFLCLIVVGSGRKRGWNFFRSSLILAGGHFEMISMAIWAHPQKRRGWSPKKSF